MPITPIDRLVRGPRRPRHPRARATAAKGTVVVAVVLVVLRATTAGAVDPTTTLPVTTTTSTTIATTTTTGSSTTTTTTTLPGSTTTSSTDDVADSSTTTSTTISLTPPTTISRSQAALLKELSGEYEELTAEELDLVKRVAAQQDKADALAEQVKSLNTSLAASQTELADRQSLVDDANRHLADTEDRLADIERQLEVEQQHLDDVAVDAYMSGGLGGGSATANALLKSSTLDQVGQTRVYADSVVDEQRRVIDRVHDLQHEADELRQDASMSRDALEAARSDVQARTDQLRSQRDQQEALRKQVEDSNAEQQALLLEVSARRKDREQRIALLSATSDGISGTLAKRQAGQQLPAKRTAIFLPPFPNPNISSGFGVRVDPITGGVSRHDGADMPAPMGTPIRAAADGVVVIASVQGGYGNCTVIDHGNGLGTLYGHQSGYDVEVGDTVKRGEVIGFVGSTGYSTGPHVHWEVREFGQPVDPLPYLSGG